MNAVILQRLIWKEYRVLRSFWLATLVLAACAAIAWRGLASWYERAVQVEDFFILSAFMTSLFALGVGGTMFSTEHEVGTADFLRRLPLDAKHLWCGKLALAFLSVIGLKAVLWSVAGIIALLVPVHGDQLRTIWWCSWVSELELFAWAALLSLLTRQPLMAITWAITVDSILIHMTLPFLWPESRLGVLQRTHPRVGLLTDYDFALPERTVFALGLLALTAALTTKWLRSPQPLSILPDWWRQRSLRRRTNQKKWLAASATRPSTAATGSGQLTRLMWLQWRQSRWLWTSLAIPFVVSGIWKLMSAYRTDEVNFLFVISTGILWLGLGVSVFHGQQAHFRFRYFAEHGVSPAHVWWSHQIALLAPLVASVALLAIGGTLNERASVRSATMVFELFGGFLLFASVVFAIGQLSGMLFRQGLVAGAMGIAGVVVHGCWGILLTMTVSPGPDSGVWFAFIWIVPFPIAWLWLSRRHVSNWILERRTRATRLRLGLCLVAPWMLMAAGLMTYRALEIPNVGVKPPTREQLLTLSDEERQTAEMYQAIVRSLGTDVAQLTDWYARKQSHDEHEKQMLEIDQRLQQSPELLTRMLAATHRPVGAFSGEPEQQNAVAYLLFRILARTERQALEKNDVSRSIELLDAQRRLLIHWRRNTNFSGLDHADYLEDGDNGLFQILMKELRTSAWQPEQYRELARKISEFNAIDQPNLRRALEREYREAIDCLNGGDWPPHLSTDRERNLSRLRWLLLIPGEQARANRLLKAWMAAQQDPRVFQEGSRSNFAWNTPWARFLYDHIQGQSRLRWRDGWFHGRWQALEVWLQFRAAKVEHGDWPASTESITGMGSIITQQTPSRGWIEYLPKGLWNGSAPEPHKVRGLDHRMLRLTGDEPCVVLIESRQYLAEVLERIGNAPNADERELFLYLLRVEPLDSATYDLVEPDIKR